MEYCLSEVFFPDLAQLGRALDRLRANLDVIIADPDPSVTVEGYGGTTWVDHTVDLRLRVDGVTFDLFNSPLTDFQTTYASIFARVYV